LNRLMHCLSRGQTRPVGNGYRGQSGFGEFCRCGTGQKNIWFRLPVRKFINRSRRNGRIDRNASDQQRAEEIIVANRSLSQASLFGGKISWRSGIARRFGRKTNRGGYCNQFHRTRRLCCYRRFNPENSSSAQKPSVVSDWTSLFRATLIRRQFAGECLSL